MPVANESSPVKLARESLTYYLSRHQPMSVPEKLPDELVGQAGVFVSLKKNGQLRGCIGTFGATRPNIAAEIIHNAISAGTQDPRFWPVELPEVEELTISVDILTEPEPANVEQLNPKEFGVIVRRGQRSGLLLPDLEGVDSVEQQLAIAQQKAGISPGENVELYRFRVIRYT